MFHTGVVTGPSVAGPFPGHFEGSLLCALSASLLAVRLTLGWTGSVTGLLVNSSISLFSEFRSFVTLGLSAGSPAPTGGEASNSYFVVSGSTVVPGNSLAPGLLFVPLLFGLTAKRGETSLSGIRKVIVWFGSFG